MIKQNQNVATSIKVDNERLKQEVQLKNARLQALLRANVQEENEQHPKSGFMFLFKLMEGFLPALLIVMFCFIFRNLFAARYVDQLDRFKVLPNKNIVVLDLILGLLVAFGWCNFTSYSAVCRKTVRIVAKCNCSLPANDLSFFCSGSDRQFRRFDK